MKKLLYILLLSVSVAVVAQKKVAFVGSGITTEGNVQELLQPLLGPSYEVQSFGESNTTILQNVKSSYWDTKAYREAKKYKPDIVLIDFGGNDAKASIYSDTEKDETDIYAFIQSFKNENPKARIILILPFATSEENTAQNGDKDMGEEMIPWLQKAAYYKNIETINMYSFFDRRDLIPNEMHPANKVLEYIAKRLLQQITFPAEDSFDLTKLLGKNGIKAENYFGYVCLTFSYNKIPCKILLPHRVAEGRPWIWGVGSSEQPLWNDIALLERGYHVVYTDQAERMGNLMNIQEGNSVYDLLCNNGENKGLGPQAVLIGKGRRGIYTFNWAAANPGKVAAVYVDNPFLNMISAFYDSQGYRKTESELSQIIRESYPYMKNRDFNNFRNLTRKFKESPTDKADNIAGGKYPILILYDKDDEAVDHFQDTIPFVQNVRGKGGNITNMDKESLKNDPDILSASSYLVDFIESAFDRDACMPFKKYNSYDNLVMAGYRGWFSCPGDGSDRGWANYVGRNGLFQPGSCSIDLWPDVEEYDRKYQTNFFIDKNLASVYSAYDASSVGTHFRWMREYGIDGVFIQRSVTDMKDPKSYNQLKKVWNSAIQAANLNNRAISILYDLTGMAPGDEHFVFDDLDSICAQYDIKERKNNTTYLFHGGRPLVAVLVPRIKDIQNGLNEVKTVRDGFKERGFSILIGIPPQWLQEVQPPKRIWGRRPQQAKALNCELYCLIKGCNIVMPWTIRSYDENTFSNYEESVRQGMNWCRAEGVDYAPMAFPGFSKVNMNNDSQQIPRNGGSFFWSQLSGYIDKGAKRLYIATFDDMNDGTAIFKCATKAPEGVSYIESDEGLQNDFYLHWTGQAAKALRGKIQLTQMQPEKNAEQKQ